MLGLKSLPGDSGQLGLGTSAQAAGGGGQGMKHPHYFQGSIYKMVK